MKKIKSKQKYHSFFLTRYTGLNCCGVMSGQFCKTKQLRILGQTILIIYCLSPAGQNFYLLEKKL